MWSMAWPILVIIAANTLYNVSSKSTPAAVNPFASLTVTYLVATAACVVMFFFTADGRGLASEIGKTNWTALSLGLAVVGLEFGFLCAYRAGWKIGTAFLVASSILSCVLLVIGVLFYKEAVSVRQLVGMLVCGAGLYLIVK